MAGRHRWTTRGPSRRSWTTWRPWWTALASRAFHLVGESIGGTAALRFAARHPERGRTLTVSNGTHRGSGITNLESWRGLIDEGGTAAWSAHMMA